MIAGILLAAGASTRFGGDKLLFPLADGIPLGVRAARNLLGEVDFGVAVVRPSDHVLACLLEMEGWQVVRFAGAADGMGASLACGVETVPDAAGWLIALADMPFIRPETIRAVAALLRAGAPLAAPHYQGRRGHPVGFARNFFPHLTRLEGDRGASSLLGAYSSQLQHLNCSDPGIFADIDTRFDLSGCRAIG